MVRGFADAFRAHGIRPALYCSLWDCHAPCYPDDRAYADYMKRQLEELLTGYGDMLEFWFDGGWDKDFPSGQAVRNRPTGSFTCRSNSAPP